MAIRVVAEGMHGENIGRHKERTLGRSRVLASPVVPDEGHAELGAWIMRTVFAGDSWGDFVAAHSRYWAKRNGRLVSKVYVADKLAFVMTPDWLYLFMTHATG